MVQGGVVSGILVVLGGALWYMRSDIFARTEAIRAAEMRIVLELRAQSVLAALKSQREEARPFEEKLQSFLPPRDQLITFSRELEELASARGVGFGFGFGAETPATEGAAGSIGFTMTVSGAFGAIISFLERVEASSAIMRIESIDITGGGNEYSLVSEGRVFFR